MAELSTEPSSCCAPAARESCCEPSDKQACCAAAAAGESCGCSAGASQPDIREIVRERYAVEIRETHRVHARGRADPYQCTCGSSTSVVASMSPRAHASHARRSSSTSLAALAGVSQ